MILVREIFQLKFARMKEAKAIWKDIVKILPGSEGSHPRLLTDLTGPYYTLVLEAQYKDLSAFEAFQRQEMSASGMPELYQKFVPLVESGRREIFTIVE